MDDLDDLVVQSDALVTGVFAGNENFQATTEFVRKLVILISKACGRYFIDRLLTGRSDKFHKFVPGLEGSTAVRLVHFESFKQQFQQVCIYLSPHDLLITLVGFESHVCQLHEIDVQIVKGRFECEFLGFSGVCPLPLLIVSVTFP